MIFFYFRQFNTENLRTDCLRADIAKLNANIVSTCFSQDIPIEFTNVTYTLENLFELLKCQRYPSRLVNFSDFIIFFSIYYFILEQGRLSILKSILI